MEWLEGLNPAQREAVEHVHGPMLVLAGAGSGKTRVLTARIVNLIEQHGVPVQRIFAVTFTNKAAGEMKARVGRMLGRDPSGLWIGTFHSLSARLLRREAELLGFTRAFTIYDEDDREALVRRLLEQKGHSPRTFTPRAVASVISAAKNRMQSPEDLAASSPFDRLAKVAADVYAALGPAMRDANAMDFDDLMLHPLALFREHPDRLAAWRDRFAFILVDEFQDTNRAQYEMVRALGGHGNVMVVGDDDQSIYGWRGADVRNMRQFQEDFPGTKVVRLEENYRSSQVVLDAANAVIAENRGRMGKTLVTRRRGGEQVTLLTAADERDEAEWVVRELARRRQSNEFEPRDMAVLYRTNAQSRAMEEAFRRAGMPYRLIGAISFYDRREVKDLLAYLRLIANPRDDAAFLRAVAVPRRGLGDTSLAILTEVAAAWKQPLLAVARAADRAPELRPNVRAALQAFAGLIDSLAGQAQTLPPAEVLERLIEAIKYEQVLMAEGPEGADRWENVRELVASAANWSEEVGGDEPSTPLEKFLTEAALLSGNDSIVGAEDGVTLMTLHTAKGLEWPLVVLSGLEHGLFPLARAEETPGGLEEERRLCYVGLTRARDKLYLTWAQTRRRGGELRHSIRSRFVEAVPPEVVEEQRSSLVFSVGRQGGGMTAGRYTGWGRQRARDDADEAFMPAGRAAAPAPEEASQDTPRYVKGERVRHRRFGSGKIQGLIGTGRDLKVSVAFDDETIGVKQLLVAYAGLERDWEGA
ncbi:MAG: UvrD-like helicase [Gemmatimonadetes bacterium]|nr:UvrD-like helicase [Gemmatimonadota bacterium]